MPELLTKYPEVALTVLKKANINCGGDAKPKILIHCPAQQFCSLPAGELCIYGIADIPQMSQIRPLDVFLLPDSILFFGLIFVFVFLIGLVVGIKIK
jgi:hypothetical protein